MRLHMASHSRARSSWLKGFCSSLLIISTSSCWAVSFFASICLNMPKPRGRMPGMGRRGAAEGGAVVLAAGEATGEEVLAAGEAAGGVVVLAVGVAAGRVSGVGVAAMAGAAWGRGEPWRSVAATCVAAFC